jgi:hypothetical protein
MYVIIALGIVTLLPDVDTITYESWVSGTPNAPLSDEGTGTTPVNFATSPV